MGHIDEQARAHPATDAGLNDDALKKLLTNSGVTVIDVPLDYGHNTEVFAELHEGVLE